MSEYRLSPDAEHDLGEMYRRGFWQFGEHQADKYYHQLFDSLELLASFPLTGRAADQIYPQLRRVEFTPYVILYMPRDYGVYVIRLLKQSQIIKPEYLEQAIKNEV
ncbi:MAG: toxin ParE1/3/4 [Candidatus Endobugula sp.]|jgi:toxin ParE1/3/4